MDPRRPDLERLRRYLPLMSGQTFLYRDQAWKVKSYGIWPLRRGANTAFAHQSDSYPLYSLIVVSPSSVGGGSLNVGIMFELEPFKYSTIGPWRSGMEIDLTALLAAMDAALTTLLPESLVRYLLRAAEKK